MRNGGNRRLGALLLVLVLALAASPAWAAGGRAAVDGALLAWESRGQGDPLLLVAGYGCTMDTWPPAMVEALAAGRRVIVYDHRGIGGSTAGGEPSVTRMAADAAGLLKALGLEWADVMGWSMGGMVAQEMALDHPRRVRKLVLYATDYDVADVLRLFSDPAGRPPDSAARRLTRLFPAAWLAVHPGFARTLPRPAEPPDRQALGRQYRAIRDWPGTWERLPRLTAPALVVVGSQDEVTPPAKSVKLAGRIPGAWLARFAGGGHGLMYQAPREMARLVECFLAMDQHLK